MKEHPKLFSVCKFIVCVFAATLMVACSSYATDSGGADCEENQYKEAHLIDSDATTYADEDEFEDVVDTSPLADIVIYSGMNQLVSIAHASPLTIAIEREDLHVIWSNTFIELYQSGTAERIDFSVLVNYSLGVDYSTGVVLFHLTSQWGRMFYQNENSLYLFFDGFGAVGIQSASILRFDFESMEFTAIETYRGSGMGKAIVDNNIILFPYGCVNLSIRHISILDFDLQEIQNIKIEPGYGIWAWRILDLQLIEPDQLMVVYRDDEDEIGSIIYNIRRP